MALVRRIDALANLVVDKDASQDAVVKCQVKHKAYFDGQHATSTYVVEKMKCY